MALTLKPITVQRVNLNLSTEEDPEQDTWVEVRQATQKEQELRDSLYAEQSRVYREGDAAFEIKSRYSYQEQKRMEVFLTLAGSNICYESKPGELKPLFVFKTVNGKMSLTANEEQFKEIWGQLPASVADAIHDAVLEVNPQWNPKSTSTKS